MRHLMIALAVVLMVGCVAYAADPIVLKAGHSANTNEPYQTGLDAFSKIVAERTKGRIKIEIYANNLLGAEKEMIEGLMLGNLDFTVPTNGVLTNFVPQLRIFDLPFLFNSREALYKSVDGEVGKVLSQHMQKKGFRLLAFYEAGVRHIMTRSKKIESINDLKGLKIRTMEIPAHIDAFNRYGAKASPLAYSELYNALQAGVMDGAEAANTNYYSKQFYRVAPYWAEIGWTTLVADLVMSEAKFQSFDAETQKILLEAARDSAKIERTAYADSDNKLLDELKKEKVTVTHPDPAPFRKASEAVYEKFASDPEMKALLKIIKENQ
jgi:TRAP-type transport system periplasmic protein